MSVQTPKRFIAGAVCPRCSSMDTIQMYRKEGVDYRECVSCGFSDEMRFKTSVRELETRVNTPKEVKEQETQVLQFKPLGSK
ncbi:YheV family putative zinc ribbon protein [Marinibactrum halimedae]|uniref:Uncharacterized protein n=1 Tax=Marinibactrum halimedae TaxID=1444977 RepID=A0AA37T337_9GAMM|nr:YheV family putative zinc ribbon protein [Marinibactrum halimedae]MCD9461043.1 YheV family putative metal-binding protein [Marinibactrum halimedae]GLS24421.1 hypothetical protein GCM10007877_01320 [Marinibactrum halimedae]